MQEAAASGPPFSFGSLAGNGWGQGRGNDAADASAVGLLLLSAAPALAEDFTGFYAGVNAGWAFERGRDRPAEAAPGLPGSGRPDDGLPPSVARVQERRLPEPSRQR